MSAKTNHKRSWLRRILWGLGALILLLIIAIIVARVFITTSGGARFIESQINKRSLGPIERAEISGFSGDPLDKFTIKSVKIYDKEGIWLTANDVAIDWSPWPLRKKIIDLQSVAAVSSELIRRPTLNETDPTKKFDYTVQLETASIDAFTLNKAVIGQAAVLEISGGLSTDPNGAIKAILDAVRTDAAGDKVHLNFTRSALGEMLGDFDLTGTAGGTLSTLLRAPVDADITGTGKISGDMDAGRGDIVINFDGLPKISANGKWTDTAATMTADINTLNWVLFDTVRSGLGDDVDLTALLNRTQTPANFDIAIKSSRLEATATGQMNPEGGLPKAIQLTASSDNLGAIAPLPEGFALGAGQIKGRADLEPSYAFNGDISVRTIDTPFGSAASVTGPVKFVQRSEDTYRLDGDVVVTNLNPDADIPIVLSAKTKIKGGAQLNTRTSQVGNMAATLISGDNKLTTSGTANYGEPSFDIRGAAALALKSMGAVPSGRLQTDYAVKKTAESLPAITANGAFKPDTAVPAPFDQLLKGGINFDVAMSPIEGGLRISDAKVTGENIRAALSGKIANKLDIDGEAVLSAPFTYAPVAFSGETAASFTLTGDRTDPNLRLDATSDKTVISGYALTNARLRSEMTDILKAPKGPLRLTAETLQGDLDVSAEFASREQIYVAEDIALTWGRLTASGNISKPTTAPASGQLSLNLPEKGNQYARADLTLSARGEEQGITLDADAKNIAYKDFSFDSFTASADGTLSSLSGKVEAKGQRQLKVLERQFNIKAPFSLTKENDGTYRATLNPDAKYGNVVLDAGPPINASYKAGDIKLNAPLSIAGSPLDITYERVSGTENFTLKASKLPITLIPMPGNLADTRGRIGADINLSTSDGTAGVTGGGTITLTDWRGFDVDPESGLSGNVALDVSGSKLGWQLKAQSPGGFTATSGGFLPITQAESLTALRPNMIAPLSGQFTASGEAAAILGLVTPSDAKPGGQLSANLKFSGTAANPNLEGQASGKDLRMEAPQLGTQLRDGRFTANFTNDTLDVRDVSITDNESGTISGQGQFKLGEFGRPVGTLKMTARNFRALDRKDFEGSVSGNVNFESTQEKATITGDVTLKRAEVKQFVTGGAAVVEIPVEEINKPETLRKIEIKAPAAPIYLDVRVRAPRRIFVRSRGLDVELSIDAAIKGTLTAPEIFGEAKVLRGGYKIAGKELAFESGGIKFDGELGSAKVNLIANTETQNLSATVRIKGTVAEPEIELSSSPERPQDEILSALLFGRSATELSTIEAAQLAGALAQFSGAGGGFDLMGGLRDALGVGQLSIGVSEDGAAQITGGRYLAKNVYLQVFSGGGTDQSGAVIDWEIRKNISLRSKIKADSDQSFSLKWKRDF